MLTNITYTLRFTHFGSSEIETCEYTREEDAREHFNLFGEDDADIYSQIDLLVFDWRTHEETLLDSKLLNQPAR